MGPQRDSASRRDFLKATAATGAAAGLNLFAARPAAANPDDPPEDHGRRQRRYIIRGGAVMSLDPAVGDFPQADVLIEGKPAAVQGSTATNTPSHIPQGGPFQAPPSNKAAIQMGSATVTIGGKAAARNGDIALTCNDPADLPAGTVVAVSVVTIGG